MSVPAVLRPGVAKLARSAGIGKKGKEVKKMENKAVYHITSFAPHYYNVHILTNGYYCGIGRFCTTWDEVVAFCKYYNVKEIRQE